MSQIMAIIEKRKSVRNYESKKIEPTALEALKNYAEQEWQGPFETKPFFRILDLSEFPDKAKGKLGSYGLIRGAHTYIAGAVEDSDEGMLDYGYCFEKIVLKATELGIGTCWLGGTFKKTLINQLFIAKFGMKPLQVVPAISPIGYEVAQKAILDRVLKAVMKTHLRKEWEELFNFVGGDKPLTPSEAGSYERALEAVRIAPSAVNQQPWRIWKEPGKNIFHFLTVGNTLMDMGIAMAHFEMVASELGLPGEWVIDPMKDLKEPLRYIMTWKATDGIVQHFE